MNLIVLLLSILFGHESCEAYITWRCPSSTYTSLLLVTMHVLSNNALKRSTNNSTLLIYNINWWDAEHLIETSSNELQGNVE